MPVTETLTVLITGASRGIGLEFTRQYAASGWRVLATCRTPATAAGLVETDLTQALVGIPKIPVEESVAALIELIENFTFEMSGSLIQHTGEPIPW